MGILLKLMQANSDIACGFNLNMEQEVWATFWKEAEQQLNAAGPPIKSMNDWKKVWSDQKKYVRKKAAVNLQRKSGTLSKYEVAVFSLVGPKKPLKEAPTKKVSLMPTRERRMRNAKRDSQEPYENRWNSPLNTTSMSTNIIEPEVTIVVEDKYETVESSKNSTNLTSNSSTKLPNFSSKEYTTKMSPPHLLANELAIQEKILEKMNEIATDLRQHNIHIEDSLREISRSLDQSNKLQKTLLDETIQHNREILKLRKIEIEEKIKKNCRLVKKEE